jgi:hypothetical protein
VLRLSEMLYSALSSYRGDPAMLPNRFIAEVPAHDGIDRAGRLIGAVIGIGVMVMLTWMTLESMF